MPPTSPIVRALTPSDTTDINLVAERMRRTLVEVLGHERGYNMYTLEWLVQRVLFHLDASRIDRAVLVAEQHDQIVGHAILRLEQDEHGTPFGLFSTIYVAPEFRRAGIATALIRAGESWMLQFDPPFSYTYTDEHNAPLINLFQNHGYSLAEVKNEFAVLKKSLSLPPPRSRRTPRQAY